MTKHHEITFSLTSIMSHFNDLKPDYAFKKDIHNIIFYQLNPDEKSVASAYESILKYAGFSGAFYYPDTESDLLTHAGIHSLVISPLSIRGRLGNLLFHHGIANYIPFLVFLKNGMDILREDDSVDRSVEDIILAFLPLNLENLFHSIFLRLGYSVHIAHSTSALEKKLEKKTCCVIIDSDISYYQSKIKVKRELLFKDLHKKIQENPFLSIIVLKNFDQGSLFDDLNSSIRFLSNILLSPEEFLHFLLRFFPVYYEDFYFSLFKKNATNDWQIKRRVFFNQKDTGSNFRNLKTLYSYVSDDIRKKDEHYYTYYQNMMEKIRYTLSSFKWIKSYILYTEAKNNRESFSFVNGSPSNFDMLISSRNMRKEESLQKKKESPQNTRILFSSE